MHITRLKQKQRINKIKEIQKKVNKDDFKEDIDYY